MTVIVCSICGEIHGHGSTTVCPVPYGTSETWPGFSASVGVATKDELKAIRAELAAILKRLERIERELP